MKLNFLILSMILILIFSPTNVQSSNLTAEQWFMAGGESMKIYKYDEAVSNYTHAINLRRNYLEAYVARGWAYRNKNDLDSAISDFTRAIEIDPNNASHYHSRGAVYAEKGDLNRSFLDFNQAIKIEPNRASHYYDRGTVLYHRGNLYQANADWSRSIKINPGAARFQEIFSYPKTNFDRVVYECSKIIKHHPNDINFYLVRAFAYTERELKYGIKSDIDLAIADYNRILEIDPRCITAYLCRGCVYQYQRRYDLALSNFNKAIQIDPNDAVSYDVRGFFYLYIGEKQRALIDFKKALECDPNNISAQCSVDLFKE